MIPKTDGNVNFNKLLIVLKAYLKKIKIENGIMDIF